ncbi:YncE family protein [Frateuria aurantia]
MQRVALPAMLLASILLAPVSLSARDWVVSAGDADYQRVAGHDTYQPAGPGELALIDLSGSQPRILDRIDVDHTIAGPPQAAAISPDGQLAFVSAPARYDASGHDETAEQFLQVVPVNHGHLGPVQRIPLASQPEGLAVSPDGRLLLAGLINGSVAIFDIDGPRVTLHGYLPLSTGRLAGVTFTHDGQSALVALRDEQGLAVLDTEHDRVSDRHQHISTGVAPYALDISSDGHWAVAGNVGLAGLANHGWADAGDLDTVSLIDVSRLPFRTVQYLPTPSLPEGVAISPNGHWIAVLSMNGSQLPAGSPGRHEHGVLQLFKLQDGKAVETDRVVAGPGGQGVVFSRDNRHLLAQYTVDRQIAVFNIEHDHLQDSGQRLSLRGGPDSIRSMPR